MPELDVNENQDVYYGGEYWNNLDPVRRMFSERIAGRSAGAVVL